MISILCSIHKRHNFQNNLLKPKKQTPMNVLIFLAEGFEEMEAVTTVDILRRAEINTTTVSITGNDMVNGAHNIAIKADILIEDTDFDNADLLVLPGGLPGAHNLANHTLLNDKIKAHYHQRKQLAAICAAPLVYGRLGLLDGETAICYPSFEPELKGATISEDTVVVSGQFITGIGPGVTMDFALEIVKQLKGENVAKEIACGLLKQ